MWYKRELDVNELNEMNKGLCRQLDIKFDSLDEMGLKASMPVDERTVQPYGLLHGGATAALAETVGSFASLLAIDEEGRYPVGMEVTAQHLRSATSGRVHALASPINLGRTVHVWDIRVTDDSDRLVAYCKLTTMIVQRSS